MCVHGVNGLSVCLHEIGDQNVNAHVCSRYIGIQDCIEVAYSRLLWPLFQDLFRLFLQERTILTALHIGG